ncbi:hypothetical protein M5D96_000963 [Drosophila gunungcola]|uniref:Uncharacterized protein n=1 Tax=Drosophila gunungcola TaxID=103775 RepID=A0A9P9YXB3_9MUSC|nr:hypothetical protein M5D96_000963 [Drosophila gunungcola]
MGGAHPPGDADPADRGRQSGINFITRYLPAGALRRTRGRKASADRKCIASSGGLRRTQEDSGGLKRNQQETRPQSP